MSSKKGAYELNSKTEGDPQGHRVDGPGDSLLYSGDSILNYWYFQKALDHCLS